MKIVFAICLLTLSLLAIAVFVFILRPSFQWQKDDVSVSKERGDSIVVAIGEFNRRYGKFPNELDQLSPEFLPEITQPTAGTKRWKYETLKDPKVGYRLGFATNDGYPSCWYSSSTGTWYEDK